MVITAINNDSHIIDYVCGDLGNLSYVGEHQIFHWC